MKPLLKWAGGKRWLLPLLKEIWQSHPGTKLVEPFAGSIAITLGLNPKEALLNDANVHLINFYNQVKKGLHIPHDLKNESAFYYAIRDRFNEMVRDQKIRNKEMARLFYFLIKTGFNGLCRFNSQGEFNVPFGQHKQIHYTKDFSHYQPLLHGWEFKNTDFQRLTLQGDEFLYVDPPYDVPFTQYHAKGFRWEDQIRLAHWLVKHEGPIVASNQATERILALYQSLDFHVFTLPAPRSISCNGDRRPAIEMLALKGISLSFAKQMFKNFSSSR